MQPERKVQGNTRLEFIADRYLQERKKEITKIETRDKTYYRNITAQEHFY